MTMRREVTTLRVAIDYKMTITMKNMHKTETGS
jgi:hypothetical protein